MSAPALAVLPGGRPDERSWEKMLLEAVDPEFRVDVYHAAPGDPVLHGPTCAVGGGPGRGVNRSLGLNAGGENRSTGTRFRGYVCLAHVDMWRRDGEPPINVWVRQSARALNSQAMPERCGAPRCTRSTASNGLCGAHRRRWTQAGRPDFAVFLAVAGAVLAGGDRCLVAGCRFSSAGQTGLCDGHGWRFRNARATRPGLTVKGYLGYLREARRVSAPSYDMSALPAIVRLEIGLALQCRKHARRAQMSPLIFGQVVRWLLDRGAGSVLERGEAYWTADAEHRFRARSLRANPLGWLRFVRQCSLQLRERHCGREVWQWDTWPTDLIDTDRRWAHQPTRRIYFSEIDPVWLRELVKRWAKWRITSATKSPASISCSTSSIRRFCRWAEGHGIALTGPATITRELLNRYRADVFLLDRSPGRKSGLLTDLKVFLDDVRLHDWAVGLPANATYYRGEIPRDRMWLPRFIDEFVMGQLETPGALDRLPDLTTRTAVMILIETGLRSVDCLRLPYDPITVDEAGAPYLRFFNHKLSREAIIPISEQLTDQIRGQQHDLTARFGAAPPLLLPRVRANLVGTIAFSYATLNRRLGEWLAVCAVRDATGRPVRVTAHQFRHTVGTRMINNEVPIDTVQRMLDHSSPEMTARYATIKDQTLRREWERYQDRINVLGEVVRLDPDGPLGDAAWAKENLARAKQTLPNGYCGLPLQQTCPHPNACLTCPSFLTTVEFLPQHQEQLERTDQLIAQAEADGRQRLVEMNTPVRINLLRIIDGLRTLETEVSDGD
jgi:integrase